MSEQAHSGSFLPSKQIKLLAIDDVDAVCVQARVVRWDYGKGASEYKDGLGTFVRLVWAVEGFDDARPEYYRLGKASVVSPSMDGKTPTDGMPGEGFFFVGTKKPLEGVPEGSVGGLLFSDVVNAGFNEADFPTDNDVRFMEGQKFHLVQKKSKTVGGDDKPHLLPTKYLGKVGLSAAQVTQASGSAAVPAAVAPVSPIVEELYTMIVLALAEGPKTKGELVKLVNTTAPADKKQALLQALLQEATLKGGPFNYDGTTVSL